MDDYSTEDYEQVLKDFNNDSLEHIAPYIRQWKDEQALKEPPPPVFRPRHFKCIKCNDEIFSKWPGQFDMCKCQESFVDQTEYYIRLGGSPVELNLRDPARIDGFLDRIRLVWMHFPDIRFGQLIQNALGSEIFYLEEDEFINQIELFYNDMMHEQIIIEEVSGIGYGTTKPGVGDNISKE